MRPGVGSVKHAFGVWDEIALRGTWGRDACNIARSRMLYQSFSPAYCYGVVSTVDGWDPTNRINAAFLMDTHEGRFPSLSDVYPTGNQRIQGTDPGRSEFINLYYLPFEGCVRDHIRQQGSTDPVPVTPCLLTWDGAGGDEPIEE